MIRPEQEIKSIYNKIIFKALIVLSVFAYSFLAFFAVVERTFLGFALMFVVPVVVQFLFGKTFICDMVVKIFYRKAQQGDTK